MLKVIRFLDIKKAHGCGNTFFRMAKTCTDVIMKSLSIISKNYLKTSMYHNTWRNSDIVPAQKKDNVNFVSLRELSTLG